MNTPFFDEESLRLLKAFIQVKDPEARKLIIALVEAAARGGTIKAYSVENGNELKTH
jgi:hypothetical protein